MATNTVNKPTADPVVFPLNHKSWVDTKVTIQNNTNASVTITVTAQNVQNGGVQVYSTPAEGALSIAVGEFGVLQSPYSALTASGTGTGTIDIVEAY